MFITLTLILSHQGRGNFLYSLSLWKRVGVRGNGMSLTPSRARPRHF